MRGTYHVTSGPMKGQKKMHPMAHTHGQGDSMTESAQWGRFSENG